jgi:hypothetical protein
MVLSLAFKASRTILSIDQNDIKSIQSVRSAQQLLKGQLRRITAVGTDSDTARRASGTTPLTDVVSFWL